MNTVALIEKLIDIERSIGREDASTLRGKVIDAQDCALRMQKEMIESLRRISSGPSLPEFASRSQLR
jgi:hypothetical protein